MRKLLIAFLLTISPAAFAGEITIPVAVRALGAYGSLWRTEIVITQTQITGGQQPVTITYHPTFGEPRGLVIELAPLQSWTTRDIIGEFNGELEPAGNFGYVTVRWNDETARFTARAHIYNQGHGGEFGQSVRGFARAELQTESYLTGLSGTDGNRTNFGIANPNPVATEVSIGLANANGSRVPTRLVVRIPPYRVIQYNDLFAQFGVAPMERANLHVLSQQPVYAYASVVRNDTGDAMFVEPFGAPAGVSFP